MDRQPLEGMKAKQAYSGINTDPEMQNKSENYGYLFANPSNQNSFLYKRGALGQLLPRTHTKRRGH